MPKPTAPSVAAYTPDDAPAPPVTYPLIEHAAIARMREALALAGATETSDVLLADVARHAALLERCATEADAVLQGDLAAATRLWLLLREPIDSVSSVPSTILRDAAGEAWTAPPRSLHGVALLRLIAGVVRAANQPVEADAMLDNLGRVLQPFFHLDIAAAAAERAREGFAGELKTYVTARLAPSWRAAAIRPIDPAVFRDPPPRPPPGPKTTFEDRATFHVDSWRDHVVKDHIEGWASGWRCGGATRKSMSQIDRFGPRYTIESLANPDACAGQTLTIRGHGFGSMGRVYFPSPDIKDPAFALGAGDGGVLVGVTPKRWTDTEVDVVVPKWATAGELHLNAFRRLLDPCATIDVYRLGNSVLFRGGLASVYEVSLGGVSVDLTSTEPRNLAPNDSVVLSWRSSGGPSTRITIELVDNFTVVWSRGNLPGGFGAVVLTVPDTAPQSPRGATLVFTAVSDCGTTAPLRLPVFLSVLPRLTITYVEVTQGVQGDLGDVLAGQGMPTVAWKDTAVRVHMNCDRGGWFSNKLDRITGSLTVDGRRLGPTNKRVVVPDSGFAGIRGLSDPNHTNDTLNFTIPAAWLSPGTHTLVAQVVCNDPSGRIVVFQTITWGWVAHNPIRVRAVYMALYGSDAFMLDYTRRALDFLPTPLTDIGIAAPRWISHTYDLSNSDEWGDLLDDLEDAWDDADEASGVRWLGIVPASERLPGAPVALQGNSGVPSIAALAMGDRPDIGAHELGHSFGLHHINLPMGGPADPYDSADSGGNLRRPPFDVRTSTAVSLPAGDLMSYMEPIRPGITTWMRIFLNT